MVNPIMITAGIAMFVAFALPPSLVKVPVLGTGTSPSSSPDFSSTILKVALALPESGSVKYASKECSPSARVFRKLAGRVIVWLSGSTTQSVRMS